MSSPVGTNYSTKLTGTTYISLTDSTGLATQANCTGTPDVTANVYQHGCQMIRTDTTTGTTATYENIGSSAIPSWALSATKTTMATSATIATTGNTDVYVIVPQTGAISSIDFSGVDALATSDTNYITWTVTNLGQAGAGSTAILATTPAGINTTKATGGTAIAANTVYPLTLSATSANLVVASGDRLRLRAAATGTLANTVTFPVYMVRYGSAA